jgi:hypothetical protein
LCRASRIRIDERYSSTVQYPLGVDLSPTRASGCGRWTAVADTTKQRRFSTASTAGSQSMDSPVLYQRWLLQCIHQPSPTAQGSSLWSGNRPHSIGSRLLVLQARGCNGRLLEAQLQRELTLLPQPSVVGMSDRCRDTWAIERFRGLRRWFDLVQARGTQLDNSCRLQKSSWCELVPKQLDDNPVTQR